MEIDARFLAIYTNFVADEENMDWDGTEGTAAGGGGSTSRGVVPRRKEYDCVICNQTSPSTEEKPMGLAVLVSF